MFTSRQTNLINTRVGGTPVAIYETRLLVGQTDFSDVGMWIQEQCSALSTHSRYWYPYRYKYRIIIYCCWAPSVSQYVQTVCREFSQEYVPGFPSGSDRSARLSPACPNNKPLKNKTSNKTHRNHNNNIVSLILSTIGMENYTVHEEIGKGSFGSVFRATRKKDNKVRQLNTTRVECHVLCLPSSSLRLRII